MLLWLIYSAELKAKITRFINFHSVFTKFRNKDYSWLKTFTKINIWKKEQNRNILQNWGKKSVSSQPCCARVIFSILKSIKLINACGFKIEFMKYVIFLFWEREIMEKEFKLYFKIFMFDKC